MNLNKYLTYLRQDFVEVRNCEKLRKLQKLFIVLKLLLPHIRGPFEKFVDSTYYSESELYGVAVTVSFSKYLPWHAMPFLQRSTHFSKTCCRPFASSFRRIVEQAVLTFHFRFSLSKALPSFENRSSSHCVVSIGPMGEL
jgi:hypothetical protein